MTRPAPTALLGLLLVLAAAAGLRFGATADSVVVDPLRADAREYFLYAFNLRAHGVYSQSDAGFRDVTVTPPPDAVRSPGYPLFLALFVDGPPDRATERRIQFAQAALGVLTVLLAWLLARRWIGDLGALLPALLTALSPHLVNAGLYLLTETLFALLVAAALVLARRESDPGRPAAGLSLGVLLGLANLVRPSLLLFAPLAALLLYAHLGHRQGTRVAALLLAGFVLVQAPWAIRNTVQGLDGGGGEVLLATLLAGIYPDFMFEGDPATRGYAYRFDPAAPTFRADSGALLGEVLRRFREQPAEHLGWFLVGKPIAFWSWDIVQGQGDAFVYEVAGSPYYRPGPFAWSHFLVHALHWPLVLLGAAGTVIAWLPATRRRVSPAMLLSVRLSALLLLYFVAVHVVLAPYPRYSIPLRPPLHALAAFAAWWLVTIARGATRR